MNGTSLSNKTATVKSLTSKRLSDFLDASSNLIKDPVNHEVADSKPTFEKYSIINLEPALFQTDEIVDEAPLLFVGKTSVANPAQNLQDIIESYKIFKEISSIEYKDIEDQFRSVSCVMSTHQFLCNNFCVFFFICTARSPHLEKEDVLMIEELEDVAEPVTKASKKRKKKQKLVQPVDGMNKQQNVM